MSKLSGFGEVEQGTHSFTDKLSVTMEEGGQPGKKLIGKKTTLQVGRRWGSNSSHLLGRSTSQTWHMHFS